MNLIRGIHNLQTSHHGCVLSIGNFDGFHRGHQALISALKFEGYLRNLPVTVMIFEPQPKEYFIGYAAPARLTNLRDKVKYLDSAKVDNILCITFNQNFSTLSAHDFVINILVNKLSVRFIFIGNDFRFGAYRQGDVTLLQKIGRYSGFEVMSMPTFTEKGHRISSSSVRKALEKNYLIEAENLLGHPYYISGRIFHYNSLHTTGFSTAKIIFKKRKVPLNGIYLVKIHGISNQPMKGIANIDQKMTVSGIFQQLEINLLNTKINLYGYHIEIVICEKIRNQQRCISLKNKKRIIEKFISI